MPINDDSVNFFAAKEKIAIGTTSSAKTTVKENMSSHTRYDDLVNGNGTDSTLWSADIDGDGIIRVGDKFRLTSTNYHKGQIQGKVETIDQLVLKGTGTHTTVVHGATVTRTVLIGEAPDGTHYVVFPKNDAPVGHGNIIAELNVQSAGYDTKLGTAVPNPAPQPTPAPPTMPGPTPTDPTNPVTTNPVPANPAPIDPAPANPAPTNPTPTDPAPTNQAPTGPAPVEPAPAGTTPEPTAPTFGPTASTTEPTAPAPAPAAPSSAHAASSTSPVALMPVYSDLEPQPAPEPTDLDQANCYLQGTQISADRGYVAVEDLREGDMVVCRFGGLRPIRWIGRQNFAGRRAAGKEAIRFAPGSIADGMPRQPLFVSPGHTMLVGETLVLADDLVNGITITREEPRAEWSYFQLDLGVHDLVLANGTWSESFADCGSFRDDFDNADDFRARFPDHVAPDAPILCAERPTGGPALHAAISHTARRALDVQGQVAPGRLEGRIEGVAAPCRVKGWAVDADHRGKPVMLDVLLDGKVIGQTIACAPRKEAGDHGRLNFVFDGSGKLTTHELLRLVVRRAEDGQAVAPLPSAAMGQLQGHLDFINDACRLEGWARDKSRPGEPVMLEAVLGEEILATFLASQRRHDLEKADLGDVAFALNVGRALSMAEMEAVEVRRMSDRAVLRRSDRTRMAFTAAGDKAA